MSKESEKLNGCEMSDKIARLSEYEMMLYVVDMIKAFVYKGALHDKHIQEIIPEVITLIELFRNQGEGIGLIGDWHSRDSVEFKTFLVHALANSDEVSFIPELQKYKEEAYIYLKNSTDAMFAPHMMEHLNMMENLKLVVVAGCCTDICILNFLLSLKNYFNQNNWDIDIVAVKTAVDTFHIEGVHDREEYENMAYKLMEQAGIILVNDINELLIRKEMMELTRRKERK